MGHPIDRFQTLLFISKGGSVFAIQPSFDT